MQNDGWSAIQSETLHFDGANVAHVMTIILFLIDTSASMLQRTYLGTNFLDVAKSAVETFVKVSLTAYNNLAPI